MRLRELNLEAVGPFTNRPVRFASDASLHIVFGPNEAGKSSALRALRSFLFGFEDIRSASVTPDNFIHPNNALRVGADLSGTNGPVRFVRRKGRSKTLYNEAGEVVEDGLVPYLGNLTVDMFSDMFGLSLEQLHQGGQDLLHGRGEIGQALFGAGAGLGRLHAVIDGLEKEAADLFKKGGRKDAVNAALGAYKKAEDERSALALRPQAWNALQTQLAEAERERAAVRVRLNDLRQQRSATRRMHDALAPFARYRAAETRLEALRERGEPKPLRDTFGQERLDAQGQLAILQARIDQETAELARIEESLAELPSGFPLIDHTAVLGELRDEAVRIRSALKDRQKLVSEMESAEADAQTQLQDLWTDTDLVGATSRRLSDRSQQAIQRLIGNEPTLRKALKASEEEVAGLRQQLKMIVTPEDVLDDTTLDRLVRLLERVRGDVAVGQAVQEAERAMARIEREIEEACAALPLWNSTADALASVTVPSEATVAAYAERAATLLAEQKEIDNRIQDAQGELEQRAQELAQLGAGDLLPAREDLAAARANRDAAWGAIRRAWEAGEPPSTGGEVAPAYYEDRVRDADSVADTMYREADRLAMAGQLGVELDRRQEALKNLRSERDTCDARLAAEHGLWTAEWPGFAEVKSPKEMAAWLTERTRILALRATLADAAERHAALVAKASEVANNLALLLKDCGAGDSAEPAETLLAQFTRAETAIEERRADAEKARNTAERKRSIANEQLPKAEKEFAAAQKAWMAWQSDWAEAIQPLGLEGTTAVNTVQEVLAAHDALFRKLEQRDKAASRIAEIDGAATGFDDRVRELAGRLGGAIDKEESLTAVDALWTQLAGQQKERDIRESLLAEKKRREAFKDEATVNAAQFKAALAALCTEAGISEPESLAEVERRWMEWREAQTALAMVDEELMRLAGTQDVTEFRAALLHADGDKLSAELTSLENDITQAETHEREAGERYYELQADLKKMDGSAAAAEAESEAQSALSTAMREAENFARIHIARSILAEAISRYRERNQGPVLERAGALFGALTLGSFAKVEPSFDVSDTPVLVGVRKSGQALPVEAMSDGTRDQLYLALRLATLEGFLEEHAPVPFILDDVFVNFDDQRTEAAFAALRGIAAKTQVIYFTHHRHVMDLARNAFDSKELDCIELAQPAT